MMMSYLALVSCCVIFIILTERYRNISLYFTIIIALAFPFIADTSTWDWFYFAKTYSVIIPVIVFSLAQSEYYYEWIWLERFHPYIPTATRLILALNIAEGGVLLFSLGQYSTALLCLILIFTIPKFVFTEKQNLGFENIIWIIGYSYCFILGFMFYPEDTNFFFPGLMAIFVPIIFCLIMRDWNVWLTFRVYSIYFILILDVIFSQGDFLIFELVNNSNFAPENRINTTVESGFKIVSSLLVVVIIWKYITTIWHTKNQSSVAYNGG